MSEFLAEVAVLRLQLAFATWAKYVRKLRVPFWSCDFAFPIGPLRLPKLYTRKLFFISLMASNNLSATLCLWIFSLRRSFLLDAIVYEVCSFQRLTRFWICCRLIVVTLVWSMLKFCWADVSCVLLHWWVTGWCIVCIIALVSNRLMYRVYYCIGE